MSEKQLDGDIQIDDLGKALFVEFSTYVNIEGGRALPNYLDGLKTVQRRLLLALNELARDKYSKSAAVIGRAMGVYHPHGDSSLYDTLVNMVYGGYVLGQGNWGSWYGIEHDDAAAYRYTECKLSPEVYKLGGFELLKYADFQENSLGNQEPKQLPCPIPLGLVAMTNQGLDATTGIGVGTKTTLPLFKLDDLIRRVIYLCEDGKRQFIPIPFFGDGIDCISETKEVLELFTKGEAKLTFKSTSKIIKENGKDAVEVTALPPNVSFNKIKNDLKYEAENGTVRWRDASKGSTRILFYVNPGKKMSIQRLKEKIDSNLKSTISFSCWLTDGKRMLMCPLDNILKSCYQNYKTVIFRYLDDVLNKTTEKINELRMIEIIRPHLGKSLSDAKSNLDIAAHDISKKTNIPQNDLIDLFRKYRISTILNVSTDITDLTAKVKEVQSRRNDGYILELYKTKKFSVKENLGGSIDE